jgi:hypothetical protein
MKWKSTALFGQYEKGTRLADAFVVKAMHLPLRFFLLLILQLLTL